MDVPPRGLTKVNPHSDPTLFLRHFLPFLSRHGERPLCGSLVWVLVHVRLASFSVLDARDVLLIHMSIRTEVTLLALALRMPWAPPGFGAKLLNLKLEKCRLRILVLCP